MFNAARTSRSGCGDAPNQTLYLSKVNTLICPSESHRDRAPGRRAAGSNYAANCGGPACIESWSGPIVPHANSSVGSNQISPANLNSNNLGVQGIQDVTDGTSNTCPLQREARRH